MVKGEKEKMEERINRGDLYYASLEDINAVGSEQTGIRPVVILQNNIGNHYSPTVIIAPVTSKVLFKAKLPTHVLLRKSKKRLAQNSIILIEQIRVIDKTRLKYYIGALDTAEIKAVDKALIIALGIELQRNENAKLLTDVAKSKEEKTEFITRRQIACYGVVAREYLKNTGNLEISDKLFADYVLTLMELFTPEQIEKQAEKYIGK